MVELFTDEQRLVRNTARVFAERELIPAASDLDEREVFARELFLKLAELGFTGLMCPEKYGGSGMDTVTYVAVLEEISRGWVAMGGTLSVHIMVEQLLLSAGNEEQKTRFLGPLCRGEVLGAIAITEPEAGSDIGSIRTTAAARGEDFVLNGNKIFITSGGEADLYLVLCRTGRSGAETAVFAVEKGTPGLYFGKKERKMGYGGSPTRELVFENCVIPGRNLLGRPGEGIKLMLRALDGGRIGVATMAVGLSQAAFDCALAYARERRQFGRPIISFQAIQFMLADMATGIAAARQLTYHAARLRDSGVPYTKEAAMAKLFASDTAMKITTDAVQILGGYGYMKDYPVERYMREAKMLQIVEGTNQIQRLVIARRLEDGTPAHYD